VIGKKLEKRVRLPIQEVETYGWRAPVGAVVQYIYNILPYLQGPIFSSFRKFCRHARKCHSQKSYLYHCFTINKTLCVTGAGALETQGVLTVKGM
jgi:hypothetical protein